MCNYNAARKYITPQEVPGWLRWLSFASLIWLAACGGEGQGSLQFAVIAPDSGAAESLEPARILPFGDSITYGMGYEGGYRIELFRQALAAGRPITFLGSQRNGPEQVDDVSFPQQHEGHGGFRIDQLMPLVPLLASPEAPDTVLLMAGTNDIGQEHDVADAPQRLGELIDRLTAELAVGRK